MESFSQKTKNELIRRFPEKECCIRAELAAMIRAAGSLHLRAKDELVLSITGENASFIRKVLKLQKKLISIDSRILAEELERLGRRRRYKLQLIGREKVKELLIGLGIMTVGHDLVGGINPEILQSDCCQRSFLRGAFIASGSLTDPIKNDYHLEINTESEDFAQGLMYLMSLCGLKAGLSRRKGYLIYLKEVDSIGRFLTFTGAHTAFLRLEEVRVVKGMRAEVNRLVNCETANLEKTVRAALEQVEMINELEQRMGLKALPEKLQEVAWLRLEYPEASLKELGELATPRLSKSAINHRMRKLLKLAKSLPDRKENIPSRMK